MPEIILSKESCAGSSGPCFRPQKFETYPVWGARYQNPWLDSKLSTVSGLFVRIGGTQAEKTLELVKLPNNFLMHAIDLGYQRR